MECVTTAQLKKNAMNGKTSNIDLTEKALKTNGCNLSDFTEPKWNKHKLEKDIAILETEISNLRHSAFGAKCEKYDNMITIRTGILTMLES